MTQSYGSREPDPRRKEPDPRRKEPEPRRKEPEPRYAERGPRFQEPEPWQRDQEIQAEPEPQWKSKLNSMARYSPEECTVAAERIDFGRRLVALILDVFAANIVAVLISFIPFVNVFLSYQLTMIMVLLVRDFFFQGRGVGKNLMGLQVVDVRTGRAASLAQAIKRNSVIVGPLFVYFVILAVIRIIPFPLVTSAVRSLVELAGTIYTLCVIPYEAYLAYSRADGRRLGDAFAGTAIVEAPMDFSNFVPRQ